MNYSHRATEILQYQLRIHHESYQNQITPQKHYYLCR